MKIVQLTQSFPPALGGVESHVMNLSLKLTEAGVDVEVLTSDSLKAVPFQRFTGRDAPSSYTVRRFRALKVTELPHGLGIIAPRMFVRAMKVRADLLHAHAYGFPPTFAASFAKSVRKIPMVITTHSDRGGHAFQKHLFDRVVPHLTLNYADRVIALTRSEAAYLQSIGVPGGSISVIPNGINYSEFSHISGMHGNTSRPVILYVGRLYLRQKGLEVLVRAFAKLAPRFDAQLLIVGEDWGGASLLRMIAHKLGVQERVILAGPLSRDRLVGAFAQADIFVLPSFFEPFGIVLLEAMAAGLPVVASRVGGIVEVVRQEEDGILVPPGDVQQLADALERLLMDDEVGRKMGERGRRRAAEYSWDRIAPQVMKVYREVLEERAS